MIPYINRKNTDTILLEFNPQGSRMEYERTKIKADAYLYSITRIIWPYCTILYYYNSEPFSYCQIFDNNNLRC